ncbi:phage tail tube protein [Streptomyces sp. NPDC054871]
MAGEITNATQIVVPARTRVWLAPVGTDAPSDATVKMPDGWYSVGLTTEDSLKFNEEPNFEQVKSAQTDFPSRTFQTSDSATIEVDLQQWNAPNFKAVFGGGTISVVTPEGTNPVPPKHYKFSPPPIGGRSEIAACIEVIDGAKVYRYIIPRAMQMEGVQTDLQKAKEAVLPLRLAVQGGDNTDAWYLITNDSSFAEAVTTPPPSGT